MLRRETHVLLVDDDRAFLEMAEALLEAEDDIVVVGTASDAHAAVDQLAAHRPEVAVVDIVMPGVDGIRATQALAISGVDTAFILTTGDETREREAMSIGAGAAAFVPKSRVPDELADTIRAVAAGETG